MSNTTETVKRGYVLKFDEELTPDEVSAIGKRLEFNLSFMAMSMGSGRDDDAQEQATKILEIAQAMKNNKEFEL
tara:strand:- start:439 stop:660 length:222 start_codon:yes stop_codon:yes gene_type:complete